MFVSKFGYIWVIAQQPNSDFHYILVSLNYKNLKYSQSFGGWLLRYVAPVSCLHLHKDCLVFMLQLYGIVLLGRKETPDPIKLQGTRTTLSILWLLPPRFRYCPLSNSSPFSIETPRNREFSFKVGKLFKLFSEMSACLYLCLGPKIASLFQLVVPSIKQITWGYPRGWALGCLVWHHAGVTLASL